jgi:heme-degrading monooxygenase HmoA
MSVIIMMRFQTDPDSFKQYAEENAEQLKGITDHAREHGVIHHRFLAGDGELIVGDEWESEQGFRDFFEHDEEIPKVMAAVGVQAQPEISVFRPLDTPDAF